MQLGEQNLLPSKLAQNILLFPEQQQSTEDRRGSAVKFVGLYESPRTPESSLEGRSEPARKQEYMSPKLLYKKKKRGDQTLAKPAPVNGSLLPITAAARAQVTSPKVKPVVHGAWQINTVINHLILKNGSQKPQAINFMQAIKNINQPNVLI